MVLLTPTRRAFAALFASAFTLALPVGCASETDEDAASAEAEANAKERVGDLSPEEAEAVAERPWEVVSSKGETVLPNVFYADPWENEQLIRWTDGARPVIDRFVYPTIGNPNLYVKDDPTDELLFVLRIEPETYAHLDVRLGEAAGDAPRELTIDGAEGDEFAFFLVARSARAKGEGNVALSPGAGVHRIVPKRVLMNAEPKGMPAVLKQRKTLRFVFDKEAMAAVPPGLYDARFEVRRRGAIFSNIYEWQSNAVRVFDTAAEEYTALNVTDTQVSIGSMYSSLTADKLDDFVDGVNANAEPQVRNAAFITFNGDLHNGGSPGSIRQRTVAETYQGEAKRVLAALKRLSLPIFLTAGNHDGYASLGHVPSAVSIAERLTGTTLKKIVTEQPSIPWPGFAWDPYDRFLDQTKDSKEGRHHDIVTGGFQHKPGKTFEEAFVEVPRETRNFILYDGFHQWQKSYGPLYTSWSFAKNRYLSVNSYDLRQHHRMGWGMYTVNYGGNVSRAQLDWIERDLERSRVVAKDEDVTLLMHHDPRGGHKGTDFGYYFPYIQYRGMTQSTVNYLLTKVSPTICATLGGPLSIEESDMCLHDGLQEWHAPDPELDQETGRSYFSAIELLKLVARRSNVRTLLLGHTHYHSMEVFRTGDTIVPDKLAFTPDGTIRRVSAETANPVRRFAWEGVLAPGAGDEDDIGRPSLWGPTTVESKALAPRLGRASFDGFRRDLDQMLSRASAPEERLLDGDAAGGSRELALIRLTSAAELTHQTYGGKKMFGWSVLHVTKQSGAPRINRLTFYIHEGEDAFGRVDTVEVDRTKSLAARGDQNPVDRLFDW